MKRWGYLLVLSLTAWGSAAAQMGGDSTFSLFFNSTLNFNHANDPHINRWLKEYGYPTEPHVPISLNFEAGAMPANSRILYSVHLSTITNASDLTAFNVGAGFYYAPIKTRRFMVLGGTAIGYHADIINLNGNLPASYEAYAVQYNKNLSLRRSGVSVSPAVRAFWYPIRLGSVLQVGLTGSVGYAVDVNSMWRLGYYSDASGRYDHFRKIDKPSDQQKVTEHGFFFGGGISLKFNLQ